MELKIVIVNSDFKVYWRRRLIYLHHYLQQQNINLFAIELFGKGSPYKFDDYNNEEQWRTCLFPDNDANELSKNTIEKSIFEVLDKQNPDIVIASSIVFFAGALSIKWVKKNKKKFVMFDDAKPTQFKRNFLVQWIKDTISSQADAFWFPAAEYYDAYPQFHNKEILFFYGYNCIDNDEFGSVKKTDFPANLICVARLVPIKNILNLLKAWQLVQKQANDEYTLIIAGDGPEEGRLIALINELGLKDIKLVGAIANSQLPGYLQNAGGFILPSLSETWGLAVNEAMAAGLPILLSNKINAAQSLLKDAENGFSFDPYKIDEIAAAIIKYINLSNLEKAAMSSKSLELIDTMSYQKMGTKLVDALTELKQRPPKKYNATSSILINLWQGKFDTSSWNKL